MGENLMATCVVPTKISSKTRRHSDSSRGEYVRVRFANAPSSLDVVLPTPEYRFSGVVDLPGILLIATDASTETETRLVPRSSSTSLEEQPELERLMGRWGNYCDALFEELAAIAPSELAALLLSPRVPPARLTFAAEILGRMAPTEVAQRPLVTLLSHASPLVREGAIYGLIHHPSDATRGLLAQIAEQDTSPAVRDAARESLDA
jgi:HEAT repeats